MARALFGIVPGVRGSIRIFGADPARTRSFELARTAQLLFQQPSAMLHPAMTLRTQLNESARLFQTQSLVEETLRRVRLEHRADALPSALSGGELRRAGIARVLLAQPKCLVADEPTTGLDAALKPDIARLLFAEGRTTLLVTHDLGVAAAHTERIVVLDQGELVDDASSLTSLSHPVSLAMMRAAGVHA